MISGDEDSAGSFISDPITIESSSLSAFYNYLANNGVNCKIISMRCFINARLSTLKTSYYGSINRIIPINEAEQPGNHKSYKITLKGDILCENVKKFLKVLCATQEEFVIELKVDKLWKVICNQTPKQINYSDGSYSLLMY